MTGFATMLRFTLRRERVRIPVYVLVLVALIASTAAQSEQLYPTAASRADYVATVNGNPGLIAMVGPPYAVTSVGGDTAWQWGAFGAVVAALMSMFIVGRHTRGEEQSGRSELVRASVVGRDAPLAAALAVAVVAQVLMGAATALVMVAADTPAAGSIALGASLAGVGILFAGVAAVAVQVSQSTGGAYGLVGAVLGASFALRAAGDVGDGTLSWLSPIGWGQAMRPYADERWWPLLLLLAFTVLLCAAAFALLARRDDGAGLLAPRPGPPHAAPALARPAGLAFRLQRGALIGWAVGLFFGGLSIGLTAQDADSILGDSKEVDELFAQAAGSLVDNYLAVSLLSMALIGIRLRFGRRAEDAHGGDRREARAAARHRARTAALGARLRGGGGRRHGRRARRERARRGDRRRGEFRRPRAAAAARGLVGGDRARGLGADRAGRRAVRSACRGRWRRRGARWRRATSRRSSVRCSGCRSG